MQANKNMVENDIIFDEYIYIYITIRITISSCYPLNHDLGGVASLDLIYIYLFNIVQ